MDLTAALRLLRRRWLPLLLCVVAGLAGAGLLTANASAKYEARAQLFVNIPAARGVQEALQGVQLSSQLIESYATIADSRSTAELVADELDGRFTARQVQSKVSASPVARTLLLDVRASDGDPATARDLANATATVLTDVITELEAGREDSIEARVIDPAVTPTSRVSPRHAVDLTVGLLLGLVAGALVVVVLEATDHSIGRPSEAAAVTGVPVLATVPRDKVLSKKTIDARSSGSGASGEAFRSLRTAVRFAQQRSRLRTVVVTSPAEGEGKTITAVNLGLAFAQAGENVVVIDADMRRGRLAQLFGLADTAGLAGVLSGGVVLDDALQQVGEMRVLTAGGHPGNASELLGSDRMLEVLEALEARGVDVVVFDTPPVIAVTDAVVLGAQVDGVVLVIDQGRTTTAGVDEAVARLSSVGATLVGTVLNNVRGANVYGR